MALQPNTESLPNPLPKRLSIRARPGSRVTAITCYDASSGVLSVDVAAQPEDNKANIALLKFLKRLTKKDVRLVSGATSKNKVVEFSE
jgi:uncharacterized protein (TIGR00251 family)